MKVIAYLRVSTEKQDAANQELEVLKAANALGLGPVTTVSETVSGCKDWRERAIAGVLEELSGGDWLLVPELSRLGRSTIQVLEILKLCQERDIHVYAVKGAWRLDGSMASKIVATVLAMVAEIERDMIAERTRAGLAARRAAGVRLGRPEGPGKSKLALHEAEIKAKLAAGVRMARIAEDLGTSPRNLRHFLHKRGMGKETK
ncbi:MAG: recombinase family protein [Thermodesulfobacteriota bacterium]